MQKFKQTSIEIVFYKLQLHKFMIKQYLSKLILNILFLFQGWFLKSDSKKIISFWTKYFKFTRLETIRSHLNLTTRVSQTFAKQFFIKTF